jgi:hypothetical protein
MGEGREARLGGVQTMKGLVGRLIEALRHNHPTWSDARCASIANKVVLEVNVSVESAKTSLSMLDIVRMTEQKIENIINKENEK